MSEVSTWDFGTMLGMGSARDILKSIIHHPEK